MIALVTGASRGIGRATALELAKRGVHCVLLARSQGGLEETDDLIRAQGGSASLLTLDLADGAAIDRIGMSIAARFGGLDILVHAAANLGMLTPVTHIDAGRWARTFAVNVTASWRLIRTTSPMLAAAQAGRAIFLTDSHAKKPVAFWGMLGASKAAMDNLVLSWKDEMARLHPNLRISLFDPGIVATRMRAEAMPGEDRANLPGPQQAGQEIARLCLE